MASIRLTQFAGLMPELSAKLKRKDNAQIAHNCLLYDGTLKAMPAFFKYEELTSPPTSLYRGLFNGLPILGRVQIEYELISAVSTIGQPFPDGVYGIMPKSDGGTFIGARYGQVGSNPSVLGAALSAPSLTAIPSVTITSAGYHTQRPEAVSYAITFTRTITNSSGNVTIQESLPVPLGTVGVSGTLWHQGDLVKINATFQPLINGESGYRLYRTITALESGEQAINAFDTDWFLVYQGLVPDVNAPLINYGDNQLTQYLVGDLLQTKYFQPPYNSGFGLKFGLTESGWFWSVTTKEIQFSERYLPNVWPIANYLTIPQVDNVRDATCFYDNLFIGTGSKPYRIDVEISEDDNLNTHAYPYPEHQPCIANTMVTAPFGALYTSVNGVIALEKEKQQVITRDLLNGGSFLYKSCGTEFKFSDITYAAWFNGYYLGFSNTGKMFVYQAPEDLNDNHPFQQLITMDAPQITPPQCWALGDFGLQIAFDKNLYYWPIPGWARSGDEVTKLCYTWKSKKFVFPGLTTFAAAKVVNNKDGVVWFRLYGDCQLIYERCITDCNPFRLPHNFRHIEFEIELIGTATVSEVHVASSMQELTEVNTE